jgi:hypothetical protein
MSVSGPLSGAPQPRRSPDPMDEPPDPSVLHLLQALRAEVAEIKTDLIEIKERLGFLEGQYGVLSRRIDHTAGDVERIKIRLALHDATLPSPESARRVT